MPVKKSTLFKRTLLLLLFLALFPAFLVSFWQMTIVTDSLEKDFGEVKARLAERTAQSATAFISNVTGLLVTIGESDEVSRLRREEYSSLMRRVLEAHPVIAELSLYDVRGSWLYGMERMPGSIDPASRVSSLGEYTRSEITRLGSLRGSVLSVANHPAVEIYLAVRRRQDRQIVGFLRSIISLVPLSENLAESKIGKSSELFILDFKERLIATSGYKKSFAVTKNGSLPSVDPQILAQVKKLGPYQNWKGRIRLSSGRDVILALHKLDELPWISAILQDRWEAFVVMVELKQKLVEVALIVSVLVVAVSLFFANRISSPLRLLISAVREIAAGDFSHAASGALPKPNNEIGELSQAFETMSTVLANRTHQLVGAQEELKRFNIELEARVEARTKELKATQDELIKQERLAAIGQMASVVGHELRNPLSVINNSIYVVRTRLGMGEEAKESTTDPKVIKHVQMIETELQVANQIISEILTFARTREIQPRDIELHEFLEEIVSRLTLPEKVELVKSYAPNPIKLNIDPDEMRQALRNIIGNAIDAMPNGGKLTISTLLNEQSALIGIEDTGLGIPPETLAKIFAPFFTTKSKGTGLGLAVVRKVLDRHNGDIVVESAVGIGTKFTLKLPLA